MSWSKNKDNIANTAVGTFTANGAVAVVVNPVVPINPGSTVDISLKTVGGTPAGQPYISAITTGQPGTCTFSVKSVAGDTSVYNYNVVG